MIAPARPSQAQEGFILIEVLVSALILAIVAGAVLTLITATTRGAASQRVHSVAYGLAQKAQAEMRTMGITALSARRHAETIQVGGTNYTVVTQSVFVSNTSQTVSCGGNDKPDYIRLTSTVTAPTISNPVTIRSVVSPTNGSLDPNVGSLLIQTKNAAGDPLPGVEFELKSNADGTVHNGITESTGCMSFGDIPAGTYTLTSTANGLVNPKGETSPSQEVEVPRSDVARPSEPILFDKPGWLQPEFFFLNSVTGAPEPATVDSMEVFNKAGPLSTPTLWGTPAGPRLPTLKAERLYPFSGSSYTVYAGSCTQNNPDPTETQKANDIAMGFAEVPPGGTAKTPPRIQLPALNLTVRYGTGAVQGATVTVTDTKCGTKRTYTTNEAGHLAATPTGPTEAGLPWSKYRICVLADVAGTSRRYATPSGEPIAVENLTKAGAPVEVDLSKAPPSSEPC
ncbi:MAG TPA: SpaA isopeptide-forming pilin-related protein [Solirubrobacterales bacterium]|nr:SpaA isopeptide-forming pilin-related protein [Solirubrobacterales bacterium]